MYEEEEESEDNIVIFKTRMLALFAGWYYNTAVVVLTISMLRPRPACESHQLLVKGRESHEDEARLSASSKGEGEP
jgi:hypothetical protein